MYSGDLNCKSHKEFSGALIESRSSSKEKEIPEKKLKLEKLKP